MSLGSMELDFQRKISKKIRLSSEGPDRFRVLTPFALEDGDHLVIVLEKEGARWMLSDEAHTYMHLADLADLPDDIEETDRHRDDRQTIVSDTLATFGIEDREGELVLKIAEERYAEALHTFIRGLLAIVNIHTKNTGLQATTRTDQDAHPHPKI